MGAEGAENPVRRPLSASMSTSVVSAAVVATGAITAATVGGGVEIPNPAASEVVPVKNRFESAVATVESETLQHRAGRGIAVRVAKQR